MPDARLIPDVESGAWRALQAESETRGRFVRLPAELLTLAAEAAHDFDRIKGHK